MSKARQSKARQASRQASRQAGKQGKLGVQREGNATYIQ